MHRKVQAAGASRRALRLFTEVRGIGILRTSPFGDSAKFAFTEFSEVRSALVDPPSHPTKRRLARKGALGWCRVLRWAPGSQGDAFSRRWVPVSPTSSC